MFLLEKLYLSYYPIFTAFFTFPYASNCQICVYSME
eukprot:UN22787